MLRISFPLFSFRYRLDAPSKFLSAFQLDCYEDSLTNLFVEKSKRLDKLEEELCEITQGCHRGGKNYWAQELPAGFDPKAVIKEAENKILGFDPTALKAAAAKLDQDPGGWVDGLMDR
jgi:hypothetical protein